MPYVGSAGPSLTKQPETFCRGVVCTCGTCFLGAAFLAVQWPHGGSCDADQRQAAACEIPAAIRHFDHNELEPVSGSSGGNQTIQMLVNSTSTGALTVALGADDMDRFFQAFKTGVLVYTPPISSVSPAISQSISMLLYPSADAEGLPLPPITRTNSGSTTSST